MSTTPTLICDALITRLAAALPSHTRLPNAYKPEENSSLYLKQAYGVAIGSGIDTRRSLSCQMSTSRSFVIKIARKYYARENDGASKFVTEKALLEDLKLVRTSLEKTNPIEATIKSDYAGDGGIEYVQTEDDSFMMIQAVFAVEYFEA